MRPSLPPPGAVLLDLDGTLLDNAYAQVLAWRVAGSSIGLDLPTWWLHGLMGRGSAAAVQELSSALGRPARRDEVDLVRAAHAHAYDGLLHTVRPIAGARELLTALGACGLPFAIVTGSPATAARQALEQLGVPDAPLVHAGCGAAPKPDPAGLRAGLDLLGVGPTSVWSVGDSVWDVQAARALPAVSIGVRSGGVASETLLGSGADLVVNDAADVLALLPERTLRSPAAAGRGVRSSQDAR